MCLSLQWRLFNFLLKSTFHIICLYLTFQLWELSDSTQLQWTYIMRVCPILVSALAY